MFLLRGRWPVTFLLKSCLFHFFFVRGSFGATSALHEALSRGRMCER